MGVGLNMKEKMNILQLRNHIPLKRRIRRVNELLEICQTFELEGKANDTPRTCISSTIS